MSTLPINWKLHRNKRLLVLVLSFAIFLKNIIFLFTLSFLLVLRFYNSIYFLFGASSFLQPTFWALNLRKTNYILPCFTTHLESFCKNLLIKCLLLVETASRRSTLFRLDTVACFLNEDVTIFAVRYQLSLCWWPT